MLLERLVGVGCYFVVLLIMYNALKNAKNYRSVKQILNVYLLILCVMAFFYIPAESADLYRWRELSKGWYKLEFDKFADLMWNSNTPMSYLMIYLCQFTGIKGVLPAVCSFIFFSNVFYVLKDLCKNHSVLPENIAVVLFFFMSSGCFLEAIAGVRCFVALSILSRCFYDEFVNEKSISKTIVFEIIAALMHTMALAILIIRLFFMLVQRSNTFLKRIANFFLSCVFIVLIYQYGRMYIEAASDKAEGYISADSTYSYLWEYIIGIATIFIIFIVMTCIKRKEIDKRVKNLYVFISIFVVICLLFSFFEYNIFHRLVCFVSILVLPLVSSALNDEKMNIHKVKNTIYILSFIILVIACGRGNLCGYKFFLLD